MTAIYATDTTDRRARDKAFAELFNRAEVAGFDAGVAALPEPMVVNKHANPLDDNSPVIKKWVISEGLCGFAWVTIFPGNCRAANYAKKHKGASKAYRGGVQIWISEFGQSYERKIAYARAYAAALTEGLPDIDPKAKVYPGGRLD